MTAQLDSEILWFILEKSVRLFLTDGVRLVPRDSTHSHLLFISIVESRK